MNLITIYDTRGEVFRVYRPRYETSPEWLHPTKGWIGSAFRSTESVIAAAYERGYTVEESEEM